MTRRERLERKLELRQEWAAKRHAKANAVFARAEQYRGDHAFNFQPGHIPERARLIKAEERAFEDVSMANHHESCAKGIESALDRSIFSDDHDAITQLEQRIAEREAERERMVLVNRLWRKQDAAKLAELGINLESLNKRLQDAGPYWGKQPHMPYELQNLGGRITADKKRLEVIKAQHDRAAKAEESENGVTLEQCSGGYVRVTFAEKPEREVLDALKAAGFWWSKGSWAGQGEKLPQVVKDLLAEPTKPTEPQETPIRDPFACERCGIVTIDVRKRQDGQTLCDPCAEDCEQDVVPKVIKGCPRDKWEEVQAIQDQPFIYDANWNRDDDSVAELAKMLGQHALDPRFDFLEHSDKHENPFYSVNPCRGVEDPKRRGHYIDGERLFRVEGVYTFFGNFLEYSYAFNIYTNHKPTIDLLVSLIEANMQREDYQAQVRARAEAEAKKQQERINKQDPFWMVAEA